MNEIISMYKELDKYKTGEKMDGIGVLPDNQEIKIKMDEYIAPLGDLIDDFIDHKNKPFWKRKYYHDHLTKLYKKMLNTASVKYGF